MSTLDGEHDTIDNGLITLLVESQRCDLWQEIVEPSSGAGVAVSASQCDVLLAVKSILASESSNAVQDTISHGGVSRLGVNDNVDETVFGVALVADDEGAAVQTLAQTGTLLVKVGVSGKVDFDDGTSDICLADTKQILFASIVGRSLVGELGSDIVVEATLVMLVAGAGVGDGSEDEEGEDGEQ